MAIEEVRNAKNIEKVLTAQGSGPVDKKYHEMSKLFEDMPLEVAERFMHDTTYEGIREQRAYMKRQTECPQ